MISASAGRRVIAAVASLAMCTVASPAVASDSIRIDSTQMRIGAATVTAQRFRPPKRAKIVALLLHGRSGIAAFAEGYRREASVLARNGIEADIVEYYDPNDATLFASKDMAAIQAAYLPRLRAWSQTVRAVVDALALTRHRIVVVGYSQGGYIAGDAAARDRRIKCAVIEYAGISPAAPQNIKHLPPLLIYQGGKDAIVPISSARALEARAKSFGAPVQLVVYPNKDHLFNLKQDNADASDARNRLVAFIRGCAH